METQVNIKRFDFSDTSFVYDELSLLNNILSLDNEYGHRELEDYWPILEDKQLPKNIDNNLLEQIMDILKSISVLTESEAIIMKKGLIAKWQVAVETEDETFLNTLLGVRSIVWEQTEHFELDSDQCKVYFCLAKVNTLNYGGICAFFNPELNSSILIQSITHYLASALIKLWLPHNAKFLPKLNSLLIPQLETLARNLGVNRIEVVPIAKQKRILQDYYGFVPIANDEGSKCPITYPCSDIIGAKNVSRTIGGRYTFLVKYISDQDIDE